MQPNNEEQSPGTTNNTDNNTGFSPQVFGPQGVVQPTAMPDQSQPAAINTPVNSAGQPAPLQYPVNSSDFNKQSKGKNTTRLIAIIAAVFLLVSGGAAAYFSLVVPNKPENVWAKALENTADGYDRLVKYADEQKDVKGVDLKGAFKVEGGGFATDGSIEASEFDGTGFIKADVGLGVTRANIESRFLKSNAETPDIYVNVSGIKGLGSQLGSPELSQVINDVDSQWIFLDHTLIDNIEQQIIAASGTAQQNNTLTPEESLAILNKTGEALREFIFTDDPAKAVFTAREFVGKEDRDGREMFHYKVGVDKEHLKSFVTSYKDKLKETKVKDLLEGQSIEDAIEFEELLKQIDTIDTNKAVADAWVDKKTKLFHAVRITDEKSSDTYFEFGTPYTGGDEYPFAIKFVTKEGSSDLVANFKLSVNTKTDAFEFVADVEGKDSSTSSFTFDMNLSAKPRTEAVNVEKPAGAKPLMEVLGEFGPLLQGVLGARSPIMDGSTPDSPNPFEDIFPGPTFLQ